MAPVLQPSGAGITWHESQIDELFASLLGRGYENEHGQGAVEGGQNEELEQSAFDVQRALKDGFRVFG